MNSKIYLIYFMIDIVISTRMPNMNINENSCNYSNKNQYNNEFDNDICKNKIRILDSSIYPTDTKLDYLTPTYEENNNYCKDKGFLENFDSADIYKDVIEDRKLDFKKIIFDDLIEFTTASSDHSNTCYNKNEHTSDDLLNILDIVDFPDFLKEELDNCKPVDFDLKTLDMILNFYQYETEEKMNCTRNNIVEEINIFDCETVSNSNKRSQDIFEKRDRRKTDNESLNIQNRTHSTGGCSFKSKTQHKGEEVKSCGKEVTFKTFVENFISKNIHSSFTYNHIRRIRCLSEAISIFDNCKLDQETYFSIFKSSLDKDIEKELGDFAFKFKKNQKLDDKIFDSFLKEYDSNVIFRLYKLNIRVKLDAMPNNQKNLFFYSELMQLYNYFVDMPELLTLGGLFDDRSFCRVTTIIHRINLFAKNIGNVKDNKMFIMCMINKAFRSFCSGSFDLFKISSYELACNTGKNHDLTFFLWEVHCSKRQDIKRRKKSMGNYENSDKKYLKTVFLTFLYQHAIFIRYFNVCGEDVKAFKVFLKKVILSKDCVGCLFNEYLSILSDFFQRTI